MEGDAGYATQAAAPAPAQAAGQAPTDGEIQLTMFDKMRRMVSTDEEWDAVLLQKMELKRNREQGLPDPPQQPFSLGGAVGNVGAVIGNKVGGVLTKAKEVIPVQLPSIPNIPIPGLNKAAGQEGAEGVGQEFTQVDSTVATQQ